MLNKFLNNSNSTLGLDIGYQSLKMVEIKRGKKGVSLVGSIEIPLKERILDRDKFRNIADTANLLKDAMKNAKPKEITARNITSALPETFVFSKTVKMPRMSAKEYRLAIPNEISDFLPIPIDQVYFDYQVLLEHPDEPLNDILVVAAPKRLVDDYVEMARLAGLELVALETKPLAVGRAIIRGKEKNGCMVIHIGTEYSRIAIWDNSNMKLSTTVNTGQSQLLESLGVTWQEKAEINDINRSDIAIPLGNIIDEAINSIKYHHNRSYKPKPIEKIILCGSGALIEGIDDMIEKEIKIKTEIEKILLADNKELPSQFIAAYGLALRDESE